MGESWFLLINIVIVILLLILFLRANKKHHPSNLRLGGVLPPKRPVQTNERNLNCMFQYNGHTWDAHEVLGVPAGCTSEVIKSGYEISLKNSKDQESRAFLEAAYQALLQQERN